MTGIEIIGRDEYHQYKQTLRDKKCTFLDIDSTPLPHNIFVGLLKKKIWSTCDPENIANEVELIISLDFLESFSEFPTGRGIYFCVRRPYLAPEVWYVGKANDFRARWANHHKFNALRAIQDVEVYCIPMPDCSKEEIDFLERTYIKMLKPIFNDTSKPEKHLRVAS